jgi:O-antigen/teichoic acid export membrane protein
MQAGRNLARRAGWTATDQAISSITNLMVTVFVARHTSAAGFGAFALVYASYIVILAISSAIASEPLVIAYSSSSNVIQRDGIRGASGVALGVGLSSGIAALVVGAFIGGFVGGAIVGLGVALPGLMLQDCWRFAFFAQGKPKAAVINDSVWCLSLALSFLSIDWLSSGISVNHLVLAWGMGAWLAAGIGCFQLRLFPAPLRTVTWLSSQRRLFPSLLLDAGVLTGQEQLIPYTLAVVDGLPAAGGFRAVQALYGPVGLLGGAARIFAIPEAVRIRRFDPASLNRAIFGLATLLGGFTIAYVSLLAVAAPRYGHSWLGASWASAEPILNVYGIVVVARMISVSPIVGLRALNSPIHIVRGRLISAPLLMIGLAVGAVEDGVRGAIIGLAAMQWVAAGVWWREFRSARREMLDQQPRRDRNSSTDDSVLREPRGVDQTAGQRETIDQGSAPLAPAGRRQDPMCLPRKLTALPDMQQ